MRIAFICWLLSSWTAGASAQDADVADEPPPPPQPSAELDGQAQVHFQSGRLHYDNGNYEQALAEFQSAYELSQRPALLYNVYLAAQNLGDLETAEEALAGYLERAEVPEQDRTMLQTRLTNLRERLVEQRRNAAEGGTGDTGAAPPAGEEHLGLMLRLTIGFGFATANRGEVTISGGASPGALAVGWAFFEDLAFQLEMFGPTMVGATIDTPMGFLIRDDSTRYTAGGIGLGATYWFMPLNLWLSGTVGVGGATVELDGTTTQSDAGLAAALAIGKEWWIGEEWGLGVGLSLYVFRHGDSSTDARIGNGNITTSIINLIGSVTYN